MTDTLTCHWVPNTFDRVQVTTLHGSTEAHIGLVRRVLGREALEALYLRGSYTLLAPGHATAQAMEALGAFSDFALAAD